MKGKIIALLIIVVASYFVYTTFFAQSFEQGLEELRALEDKNSARETFLVPITQKEINNYKNGLNSLKLKYSSSDSLKKLFEIKMDLVLIQENLLEIGENFDRANKISVNCSANSEFDTVTRLSDNTLKKANSVLAKRNAFTNTYSKESLLVSEISNTRFENAIKGLKNGVEQIQKIVTSYC